MRPVRWLSASLATLAQDLRETAWNIHRKRGVCPVAQLAILAALKSLGRYRKRTLLLNRETSCAINPTISRWQMNKFVYDFLDLIGSYLDNLVTLYRSTKRPRGSRSYCPKQTIRLALLVLQSNRAEWTGEQIVLFLDSSVILPMSAVRKLGAEVAITT